MKSIADSLERLQAAGIAADQLREEFARSSGPGGQHVNKVETAIRLVHTLSGLVAQASEHRSREMNRRLAYERLADAAELLIEKKRLARLAERAKKRRRAARRSPAAKRKILESKRHNSEKKQNRRKVE